jgi:hypothetical protein
VTATQRHGSILGIVPAGVVVALLLGACGGQPGASSTAQGSTSPSTSTSASTSVGPAGTGATPDASNNALDPCRLVTSQEASRLAGVSYGAGAGGSGGTICFYGAQAGPQNMNMLAIFVGQAPAGSIRLTARQAAETNLRNWFSGGSFTSTELTSFSGADQAAVAQGNVTTSGYTLNGSDVAAWKGALTLVIMNLVEGHPSASSKALEAQAHVSLGRLP